MKYKRGMLRVHERAVGHVPEARRVAEVLRAHERGTGECACGKFVTAHGDDWCEHVADAVTRALDNRVPPSHDCGAIVYTTGYRVKHGDDGLLTDQHVCIEYPSHAIMGVLHACKCGTRWPNEDFEEGGI